MSNNNTPAARELPPITGLSGWELAALEKGLVAAIAKGEVEAAAGDALLRRLSHAEVRTASHAYKITYGGTMRQFDTLDAANVAAQAIFAATGIVVAIE